PRRETFPHLARLELLIPREDDATEKDLHGHGELVEARRIVIAHLLRRHPGVDAPEHALVLVFRDRDLAAQERAEVARAHLVSRLDETIELLARGDGIAGLPEILDPTLDLLVEDRVRNVARELPSVRRLAGLRPQAVEVDLARASAGILLFASDVGGGVVPRDLLKDEELVLHLPEKRL